MKTAKYSFDQTQLEHNFVDCTHRVTVSIPSSCNMSPRSLRCLTSLLRQQNIASCVDSGVASHNCRAASTTSSLPTYVKIVEVGPRDGLQNEPVTIPTETKIQFIDKLATTGLPVIEATSFVSPKWVPQLADAADVMTGITRIPGVHYTVLTPNLKGLERALQVGVDSVSIFTAASEAFNRKNINASIEESLVRFEPVMAAAKDAGVPVRGYVSCVVGCPYQGAVSPRAAADVAGALYNMGCYEVSMGDTIGCGTAASITAMFEETSKQVSVDKLAAHFHDTYGQGVANILAALQCGVAVVDASVAGLGGCPYAPGASGNVATEDVVYLLEGLGIEHGVDLDALCEVGHWICERMEKQGASRAAAAIRAARKRVASSAA